MGSIASSHRAGHGRGKWISSTARQVKSGLGIEAQRNAVVEYLNGGNWSLVKEYVEVESGKNAEERVGSDRVKTDTMTTIDIIRCSDGTYAITVNGAVVAAGLTNGAAWREADRLVESDTNAENANGFGGASASSVDRARHH